MPREVRVPFQDLRAVHARTADKTEAAVLEVLRSGQYVGGPKVEALESAVAARMGRIRIAFEVTPNCQLPTSNAAPGAVWGVGNWQLGVGSYHRRIKTGIPPGIISDPSARLVHAFISS